MNKYQILPGAQALKFQTGGGADGWLRRERGDGTDFLYFEVPYLGVYGMGEKFDGINQKGRTVVNEVIEQFCHQGEKTYLSAPFFVTDSGMGVYVHTKERTVFDFQAVIRCEIPADAEVTVFTGSVREIVAAYMGVFGPALLPPRYAFGIWISANHWNCERDVEEQLAQLEQYDFPASVMVLEAWSDEATFYIWNGARYKSLPQDRPVSYDDFEFSGSLYWKNPRQMISHLHEKGIRLVLWQIPVYKEQSAEEPVSEQLNRDREYAVKNRLCVFTEAGEPYRIPESHWFEGSLIPDFTNTKTRQTWFDRRRYLLESGVDGFKTDGGEFIYREDLCFASEINGREAGNAYAQIYTEAYTEFLGEDNVLFSRAGFAGAHRTPIHWAGDQQSENSELRSALQAGLSAAMTGIPFWSFDIAGFAGPLPTPELYIRATQLACFVPVMQWHSEPDGGQFGETVPGAGRNNERSPWNMEQAWQADGLMDEIRYWHKLRMNLIPYLYSTAIACCRDSRPMMYPLVYEWQQEEAVLAEDEFMLGESLLIAPLLEPDQRRRTLWLPEGVWYGFFTHKRYAGGREICSDAAEKFPVYLREGTGVLMLGGAKDGLDRYDSEKGFASGEYHAILAGADGTAVFEDGHQRVKLCWKDCSVSIEGQQHDRITWEVI